MMSNLKPLDRNNATFEMMRPTPTILLLLALLLSAQVACTAQAQEQKDLQQQTSAQREALVELNEAARAYREGNFIEAQWRSERALAMDPKNKKAPFFIARTIHAQYKPGDTTEANVTKAREAITAYQNILASDPLNDEAYKAVAYLYGSMKEEILQRQWILERANNTAASAAQRSEAYIVLASKDWECSYKITELPTHKQTVESGGQTVTHYLKASDQAEFEKAKQCATSGSQMVDLAIDLAPDNESAWSYKTNILLELAKLAEMDNELETRAELNRAYQKALARTTELSERNAKTKAP
jgi:hypothetical protein